MTKAPSKMITKAHVYLFLISMLMYGCQQSETGVHHENPRYEATTPFRKDVSIRKEYVCQIHGIRHIEVRAMEKGYLQNIYVDEGQMVHQGQPMFKIMPNIYQAELMKAQAEANIMNIEYTNTKGLADQNIVSKNELALAKAKLDKANAEVKLAETHLSFTDIKAPFNGIMDHLLVRNGSLLDEGTLLTTLSDISKLWVYFNVPESEYLEYKTKKNDDQTYSKVRLKMANGAIFDQEGTIETIEADFDNTAGNIEFRATFPNPDGILRHGQTGTIIMRKPYKNALLIPQKATFEVMDKMFVYVIDNDGTLEQRLITIDAEIPYFFLVKEGVKDDDKILIEGLRKVHPGDHVDVTVIPKEKLQSNLQLHAE
ncbi:efflux RND transporter periplasmic adaptor subunit [Methylococcus sp. Mc7]|uniref:efflux RND transporter periplasmic adaptor subunit n=1 Tax=Methylococcus sp. Mc7 TaxID=2860258 RepID=UPI0021073A06|nr:efflux RND transporter periplasmic adaptor subunit [Methylococcus sp. Mc7]